MTRRHPWARDDEAWPADGQRRERLVIEWLLWSWVANTVALGAAILVLGDMSIGGVLPLLVAGAVFALVNALVRPVLRLLSLPLIPVTFGVVLFLINMLMVWLTGLIVDSLDVGGFVSIAEGTVVIWLVNLVLNVFIKPKRKAAAAT